VERLARGLYSAALSALTPLYRLRLRRRGRKEAAYLEHVDERFGRYAGPAPDKTFLWLHAVSLGETRAAAPLIDALRRRRPGLALLLTTTTATGREAGAKLLRDGDVQAWLPYDTPGAVRRFLQRFRPIAGVLMETEVWPNLLHGADEAGVPVVLANARLSERSARKGRRLSVLLHAAAARFTCVLAQTEADAARFREAGAEPVEVCGNLKFDVHPTPALLDRGAQWKRVVGRPVVVAASTREGEEAALLDAWRAHPAPRPLLLLVPRHPQRFGEVAAMTEAAGFVLLRRSAWGASDPPSAAREADVWLGDSMGEMPMYYAAADVALLGGSFEPFGGQNLIEAAACGCPVIMGPHTYNFAEAASLSLAARAALRVKDLRDGVEQAISLAEDGQRHRWAERALQFARAHRGATECMTRRIDEVIEMALSHRSRRR
jgi:3-deoxy-D-manno-octulosonic-acid transferase